MYMPEIAKRQFFGGYGGGYNDYGNSNWDNYGRWILLGGIILVVLLIAVGSSCVSARRRRNRGAAPFKGTGWMAPQHGDVMYYGPGGSNATPMNQYPAGAQTETAAPPYQPQHSGFYGQQNGVEMEQPQQAYYPPQGNGRVYAPPEGMPPAKN